MRQAKNSWAWLWGENTVVRIVRSFFNTSTIIQGFVVVGVVVDVEVEGVDVGVE